MAERVVVAMSGGVDSSVAAALMVEAGHDVVGVTLRVRPGPEAAEPARRFGACCGTEDAEDARRVARALGIPHFVLNSEEEFERAVIGTFIEAYRSARTPVPCLTCNTDLKFGSLLGRARAWGARGVATGHYARVTRDAASGRPLLWRPRDRAKDQTYFLWSLTRDQLEGAHFPVGELCKADVRAHARRLGLSTADKPESQEICFIPGGNYREFLRQREPAIFQGGPIQDREGRVLGAHDGVAGYTVGQRRGLGLATGRPLYVVALDAERHTVTVGDGRDLETSRLVAERANFIAGDPPGEGMRVEARIRHNHVPAPGTIRPLEAGRVAVAFDEPQRAAAPGQSVVFYQGDLVVGGGIIASR